MTSKRRGLYDSERGVSPVVGVALLIAITVILAAVIGFVVLNTSNQGTELPNARLDFAGQTGDATVTVTHEGGDAINASNVVVKSSPNDGTDETLSSLISGNTRLTTGDEFTLSADAVTGGSDNAWNSGDTVRLVWQDPDSDRATTLAEFKFP